MQIPSYLILNANHKQILNDLSLRINQTTVHILSVTYIVDFIIDIFLSFQLLYKY